MLEDQFPLYLTADELFVLHNILDEWMSNNPHLVGPCVNFLDSLYDKVHEIPYPTETAEKYQALIADFEAARLHREINTYRCPRCQSPVEMGPETAGGFCFNCLVGFRREHLHRYNAR